MAEPLIRWLTTSGKRYDIASCGLKLASKWYADDGTLLTNSVEDMISLQDKIQQIGTWSSIHLNAAKCKLTAYIHALQAIPPKKGSRRRTPLASSPRQAGRTPHRRPHAGRTLPGGYLGTSLIASLSPTAHLQWTKS